MTRDARKIISRTLSAHPGATSGEQAAAVLSALAEAGVHLSTLEPNQVLIQGSVAREWDDPGYESTIPGSYYCVMRDFSLVADTVDPTRAEELAFEFAEGDPIPDGLHSLSAQIAERFGERD